MVQVSESKRNRKPVLIPISVADLLLSSDNPRLRRDVVNQAEALNELARVEQGKLIVLAQHMLKNGLSPADFPLVTPHPSRKGFFIVLEGNRRVAALKALESPSAVSDGLTEQSMTALKKLAKDFAQDPIESVMCSLMTEEEARPWIILRHTGENGGAGTSPWSSIEASRYRNQDGDHEIQVQAVDFLTASYRLAAEEVEQLHASTLKRVLGTPEIRDKLGLEWKEKKLLRVGDERKVADALMHLVGELVAGVKDVNDFKSLDQRRKYAESFPKNLTVKRQTKLGDGVPLVATTAGLPVSAPKPKPLHIERMNLIPSSTKCPLNITEDRIAQIAEELSKLHLVRHKNAVSVLFRVFIELSVDHYLQQENIAKQSGWTLGNRVSIAAEKMKQNGHITNKEKTRISNAFRNNGYLAPTVPLLNAFVHDPKAYPASDTLRAHWDNIQSMFEVIWPL